MDEEPGEVDRGKLVAVQGAPRVIPPKVKVLQDVGKLIMFPPDIMPDGPNVITSPSGSVIV